MDDTALMSGGEPQGQLSNDLDRLVGRQMSLGVEQFFQRQARHEIHADQPDFAVTHEIVDAHDMRARNLTREQELLAESFERVGTAGQLRTQQFQCDVDIELDVVRLIDDAHAAHAEQAHDAEAVGDDVAGTQVGHRQHAGHGGLSGWRLRSEGPAGGHPGDSPDASRSPAASPQIGAPSGRWIGSARALANADSI
jgi:predicted DNA-binding WGR domain protein